MIYLLAYLLIGVALVVAQHLLARYRPTRVEHIMRVLENARRRRDAFEYPNGLPFSLWSADVVGKLLANGVAVITWPRVAVALVNRFRPPPPPWRPEPPDFTKGETYHEVLTVEEIEARERVDDESNGMIGVPFGYLNPVWLAFKAKLKEGDEICVYRYTPFPGQPWYAWWSHGAEGYALRRGGEVIEKIIAHAD